MTKISIISGDITLQNVDMIIAPTNNSGNFFGAIDNAIRKVAGGQYHNKLLNAILHHVFDGIVYMGVPIINDNVLGGYVMAPTTNIGGIIKCKNYNHIQSFDPTPILNENSNLKTYIIEKTSEHNGDFDIVFFFVDEDFAIPVDVVVYNALKSANEYALLKNINFTVALPLFRQGLMKSLNKVNDNKYAFQYIEGLFKFLGEKEANITEIKLVIYKDDKMKNYISELFNNISSS